MDDKIWTEPLTENEEEIIRDALIGGNKEQIEKWCNHLLKMAIAQREVGCHANS